MESLDFILSNHPLLKGLDSCHMDLLVSFSSMVTFQPGEFIFRQGEEANSFYLIYQGKVDVEAFSTARGPLVIQRLGNGGVLGWSWLMPPYHWRFDARSVEVTTAIALDTKRLRATMEDDHDLGYELVKRFLLVLAQRLEAARLQLMETYAAHS